jgi:hypothetical protein
MRKLGLIPLTLSTGLKISTQLHLPTVYTITSLDFSQRIRSTQEQGTEGKGEGVREGKRKEDSRREVTTRA